jgi:hypothetical protein
LPTDPRIERLPITHPDAMLLIEAVQQEYVERYGGRDNTPMDAAELAPPVGAFFVGYVDERPVMIGAWRLRPDVNRLGSTRAAEVKRMYVAPPPAVRAWPSGCSPTSRRPPATPGQT